MTTIDDAYRRFSTRRFPLPSESQVDELEQRIGVPFPDDFRQYILDYNGGHFCEPEIAQVVEGCPQYGLRYMHGVGASHSEAELAQLSDLELFDENVPPKVVPIGYTSQGGLIVLVTEPEGRGEIYLKQAFGDFYFLADGIEEFFELLKEPPWEKTE